MNINETVESLRNSFTNYTLTITEMTVGGESEDDCCECGCGCGCEDDPVLNAIAVRMVGDDWAVTVIKEDNGENVLEDTAQETFDRLVCLANDEEYDEDLDVNTMDNAAAVLKATLEEIGFDKAVSLLERLNALSVRR